MSGPTRRETTLAAAFAILVVILVVWLYACEPSGRLSNDTGNGAVQTPGSFTISGDLPTVIVPGVMKPLDLILDNPNSADLAIDRITVTVLDIKAPQADADHPCSAEDFEVRQISEGVVLTLGGNETEDLTGLSVEQDQLPAIGMLDSTVNQDGCKGASLTLGYEASGTEVTR